MRTKAVRSQQDRALDEAVGTRIRIARQAAGMNQAALARDAGVTFQQVQKYEKGANRVSASRMALIARALGVTNAHIMGEGEQVGTPDIRKSADLARLIANYRKCGPEKQKAIRDLASTLASVSVSDAAEI